MGDINKQAELAQTPHAIYLQDYRAPAYWVDQVEMEFELGAATTRVKAVLHLRRNEEVASATTALVLNGDDDITLVSVAIDDKPLTPSAYHCEAETLTIENVPAQFKLETVSDIHPAQNTALEGLYASVPVEARQKLSRFGVFL